MIGIDTNVLVRLFIEDDPAQSRAAWELVSADDRRGDPMIVVPIALAEMEWALRSIYGRSKGQIVKAMDLICEDGNFIVDHRHAVETAIAAWRRGKADFADYLIAALARERGARTTVTFDRKAAETAAFTLLDAPKAGA